MSRHVGANLVSKAHEHQFRRTIHFVRTALLALVVTSVWLTLVVLSTASDAEAHAFHAKHGSLSSF